MYLMYLAAEIMADQLRAQKAQHQTKAELKSMGGKESTK
jgi:hypothetical protein